MTIMRSIFLTRPAFIWSVLVLLTFCSVGVLQVMGALGLRAPVFVLVLVIAYLKVRIVGLNYMELRSAPRALRFGFEAWLAIVTIAMVVLLSGAFQPPGANVVQAGLSTSAGR